MHKHLQESSCVKFTNVQLVKASHMAKPRITVGGDCARERIDRGMIHWESLLPKSHTLSKWLS